ncbi:hypothetical protein Aple_059430 [Acrocarpospora pleiomorpha]|uniref:RRM domain-containing protein n=1 Tax=Acrocarpospora pleiomorpha TaxID=90975 RepID=A0A5M3XP82_9ACTN|nr:ATP-binding protein [Acrocarpospora pleiomorpha]GES23044.1 hypothetical protein Aple_059430 [Acrocarpospora pleiomorpha]
MASDDPLTLSERVRATLQLGESHFREFKSAVAGTPGSKRPRDPKSIRKDIGEALVAFANADGGELLVGVEDSGIITGVPHDDEVIGNLFSAWQTYVHLDTPLPTPRTAVVALDGKKILYFSVEKGTEYVYLTSDGRCLQRRDRESIPVPSERISFERQERLSREYDRAFIDGGDANTLDLEAIERIGDQIAPGLSPEKVLQLLDLAEFSGPGVRLRRAAVLLLAKNVSHWHPRCEVRILRVSGIELRTGRDYNVVSDKHVSGCILDLLSTAWEELRPYLVETRLGPEGRFEEQVRYPEDACREALTNAIAHRDYSIEGRGIEVLVFDDRLEVHSPGALLSTVTVEGITSLKGVHQSRNTIIARTLRELGYMREMGEGFRRIFQLMRAHDLVAPQILADNQSFLVALRHKSVFSEEDQRWIAGYEYFDLERDEEKVLLLGRKGDTLSVQQIMDAVDLVDTEDYRALIERLQRKGLIQGFRLSRTGVKTRNSPRWRVVQPKDASRYFGELAQAAQIVYHGEPLTNKDFTAIGSLLGTESPYAHGHGLAMTFRGLGLTDPTGNPIGRLRAVITQTVSGNSERQTPLFQRPKPGLRPPKPAQDQTKSISAPFGPEKEELATARQVTAEREPKTLYVGNLARNVTPDELRRIFESVGPVARIFVPRDFFQQKANRGYGFVEMNTHDGAKLARTQLEGVDLRGQGLHLEWAKS